MEPPKRIDSCDNCFHLPVCRAQLCIGHLATGCNYFRKDETTLQKELDPTGENGRWRQPFLISLRRAMAKHCLHFSLIEKSGHTNG